MRDHPKLTARQQEILDLIQNAISRTGAPPTRAEIASTLGFKSANSAEDHLKALARKGVIELVSGVFGLDDGPFQLGPHQDVLYAGDEARIDGGRVRSGHEGLGGG